MKRYGREEAVAVSSEDAAAVVVGEEEEEEEEEEKVPKVKSKDPNQTWWGKSTKRM